MTTLLRRLALPVLPFTLLGAALAGAPAADAAHAPSAARSGQQTLVIGDCQKPAYEPRTIVATCADANAYAVVTTYDSWTAHQARGKGRLVLNDCKPNCAAGHFHRYPATFSLHKVVTGSDGTKLFSRLGVTYVKGGEPHDITFGLPTSAMASTS